jgi:hypothetical protein
VRLVKDGLKAMTLAIGDGANDVSMIQVSPLNMLKGLCPTECCYERPLMSVLVSLEKKVSRP